MANFQNITVPQFNPGKGGLNLVTIILNVFSIIIILFGLIGAFTGGINGMKFSDGIMVACLGLGFMLCGYLLMKFGINNTNVVFYTDRIELTTKRGEIKKTFTKEAIQYIAAYESLMQSRMQHIPFDSLNTAKSNLTTFIIYIDTQPYDKERVINLFEIKDQKKSLFLHNNEEACSWIKKYYAEKIKAPNT
ncbi:MAG: hypothetical protein LC115_11890 [Bacteroidia bacterium]|nr:hypothetical protein [Bacteroidia bacterium]